MVVREARASDSYAIATVSVTTWKSAYRHILPDNVLDELSVEQRAERVKAFIDSGSRYWVAEKGGKIVGFITLGPNNEEVEADAELKAIYVLPEVSGEGIGRALLRESLPWLIEQGMHSMVVFAFKANDVARGFYCGLGAQPHSTSSFEFAGVDYPDQSYVWDSLEALLQRLGRS